MKDAVDLGSTRQLVGVHLVPGALNTLLKVHTKLLHHPVEVQEEQMTSDWCETTDKASVKQCVLSLVVSCAKLLMLIS